MLPRCAVANTAQGDGGRERAYTAIEANVKCILSRTFNAHFKPVKIKTTTMTNSGRFVETANNKAIRRLNEMLVKYIVSIILELVGG